MKTANKVPRQMIGGPKDGEYYEVWAGARLCELPTLKRGPHGFHVVWRYELRNDDRMYFLGAFELRTDERVHLEY